MILVLLLPSPSEAQSDPQTTFPSSTAPKPSSDRLGKYQVGPLYLTPRLRFGPISYDSNVLYSATDVQSDVIVTAGPALDVVAPLGSSWRFDTNGTLDYLYFVRTESQRQFTGSASARLTARGARTQAVLEEFYGKTFGRPGYDVDQRVEVTTERTRLTFERSLFSRLSLDLEGFRQVTETASGEDYLGTDFAAALTTNQYLVAAELGLAISVKTSLVARGEYDWRRFPVDPVRDGERSLIAGGLRTDATALIAGHALLGRRVYRPEAAAGDRATTYVNIDARVGSSKTRIGGAFLRDLQDSFFLTEDGFPVQLVEALTVVLERRFSARFDVRMFARQSTYKTQSPITIDPSDGPPQTALRDDMNRDAGVDVGYRLRPSFRVGITATYRDRSSPFSTFNVEGLLVGFNAQLNPDLPWID